jgi:hypothetical protein
MLDARYSMLATHIVRVLRELCEKRRTIGDLVIERYYERQSAIIKLTHG